MPADLPAGCTPEDVDLAFAEGEDAREDAHELMLEAQEEVIAALEAAIKDLRIVAFDLLDTVDAADETGLESLELVSLSPQRAHEKSWAHRSEAFERRTLARKTLFAVEMLETIATSGCSE